MNPLVTFVFLASMASLALAQDMMVNSLTGVMTCEPIQITWSGGQPPYYLSLIPAGQPAAPAIKQFPTQQETSLTWIVDIAAGGAFTTQLKDSTGKIAYSGEQTVQQGTTTNCTNSSVTESGSVTGSATTLGSTSTGTGTVTSAGFAAASASVTATPARNTNVAASASHTTGSTSASSPTHTQNGAPREASFGAAALAAIMGFIGFTLL